MEFIIKCFRVAHRHLSKAYHKKVPSPIAGQPVTELLSWTPPDAARPYIASIRGTEQRYKIPKNLLARLLYQESHYRPEIIDGTISSRVGAMGIAQVMPLTAKDPGFGVGPLPDPLNPFDAIPWAGKYLAALKMRLGSWDKALAAYNWGYGRVTGAVNDAGAGWLIYAPTETRNYVAEILNDVPGVV